MDGDVWIVFVFSFLFYKGKLPPILNWLCLQELIMGCQAYNYNSQALCCNKTYSKVVHWVSNIQGQTQITESPQPPIRRKKQTSILSMHIKVIVLW